MLQFEIAVNTLKVSDGSNTIFSISKKDVYYIQTSLNEAIPIVKLYNVNVGIFSVVFSALLSDCSDPNGDPFTVNSFTTFAEDNLGFNSGGASPITVTDSYATLPDPTTVSGQFYWCENADGTFPVGLYYSDGIAWQFQVSDDITVVANYSALPNPTTVSGQFFWCESSQGTSWLPANLGGTYYSAGMYYSNGVSWSFLDVPYQATQLEVDTGTNTNKFVTPSTFTNASKWNTKQTKPSYMSQSTPRILSNTTALQKIFNVGTLGDGSVNVTSGRKYLCSGWAIFSGLSAVGKTISFGVLGTATASYVSGIGGGVISNVVTGNQIQSITSFSAVQIVTSSATTIAKIFYQFEFNCNGNGTIQPAMLITASNASMQVDSGYFEMYEVSDNTNNASPDIR
jgi:hypothetical protein